MTAPELTLPVFCPSGMSIPFVSHDSENLLTDYLNLENYYKYPVQNF